MGPRSGPLPRRGRNPRGTHVYISFIGHKLLLTIDGSILVVEWCLLSHNEGYISHNEGKSSCAYESMKRL